MLGRGPLGLAALGTVALLGATGYVLAPPAGGQVVDTAGNPVAGASVTIRAAGIPESRLTAPGGSFRLPVSVPLASREVIATAPGFLPGRSAGSSRVVLNRRPSVFGRMTDESGLGIDHAVVTVAVDGKSWQTVSDAEGFFWLEGAVDAGHAYISATAAAHDAYRAEADLAPDHAFMVAGVLTRQLGRLVITTDPAGLAPTLDGAPLSDCPATPCSPLVTAGHHVLNLNPDNFVPWSSRVIVWEGTQLAIPVTLERKTGSLQVSAPAGAGAVLSIDGRPVNGLSWTGVVSTGPHTIAYAADDHWPAFQTVNVEWNKTAAVSVSSAGVTRGDEAGFLAGMTQYLNSLSGQYSAWVTPVAGGAELGYQANSSMEAASVIKLPLALFIEKQAQDGKLKLSDQVTLQDDDFMGGTGTLSGSAQPGDKYAIGDLLALLIQQSDNTAWKALRRALNDGAVDSYTASIKGPDCHQADDQCTTREAGLMMQALAAGQLLDPAHTQDLMHLLETTAFNDRINAYLGGVTVAHKVGMDGSVINDTGVVLSGRPFVVSVFTNADPAVGVEAIRQVSRLAARLYG